MHQNYFKELELQNKIWNLIKKNSFKICKINEKNHTSHRSWTTKPSLATFSSSTLIIFTIRGFPNICLVVFFIIVENIRICEILKQLNNLRLWWGLLICFEYEMGLLDLLSLFSFFLNYEFLIFYRVYFIYLIDKEKLHYTYDILNWTKHWLQAYVAFTRHVSLSINGIVVNQNGP